MPIKSTKQTITRGGSPTTSAPVSTSSLPTSSPGGSNSALTFHAYRLPEIWIPRLPKTKVMLYGESGTGKSTFAATYSDAAKVVGKPILVVGMDPPSKMSPYRDVGYDCVRVGEDDPLGLYQWYLDNGVLAEDVVDRDGNTLIRIECYLDPDPDNPVAANVLEARFAAFGPSASDWYAVIRDSMTFFQYAVLRQAKIRLPIDAANEAKGQTTNLTWYNMVKMGVERFVKSQGLWWDTNLVDIYHTSEDKSEFADTLVRGILAVGKLKDELPPGYDEIYKVKIDMKTKDERGFHRRYLQTRHDAVWTATSVTAKAPNPCDAHYLSLWENWVAAKEAKGIKP